jgi:hypothetical protein
MATFSPLSKHIRPLIVAAATTLGLALGMVRVALPQDGGEPTPTPEPTGEQAAAPLDTATCAECHPDVVAAWDGGPHAMAYEDPVFQSGWQDQDFDPACLECHTTGYRRETHEYRAEGVTCEECHGVTSEGHPPEPVDLNRANQTCINCHLVTQAEFRASVHEDEGLECTSCHYAHNNGLRLRTEVEQCLGCHDHQLDDFAHASHIESGLACRDCHGYVKPGLEVPPDGLGPTGHDFQENVAACLDCHQNIELVPVNGEDGDDGDDGFSSTETQTLVTGGQQAELRATQLEAVLQTLVVQQHNRMAVAMIESGAGGLLAGVLGIWLFTRRQDGKTRLGHGLSRAAKLFGKRGSGSQKGDE